MHRKRREVRQVHDPVAVHVAFEAGKQGFLLLRKIGRQERKTNFVRMNTAAYYVPLERIPRGNDPPP